MKQTVKMILVLMLAVALLCGSVQAAGETYTFDDFDLEITVPEGDYYILLRDMDPEDPVLADTGLTAEQVNEILESGNAYLDALYYDASYELKVMVLEGEEYEDVFNYEVLSKLQRNMTASQTKREIEREGVEVAGDLTWEEINGVPYMVIQLGPVQDSVWSYQYQTIYNGRWVSISAISVFLEEPTEEILEQLRLMVEGVRFTRKLPTPQSVLDTYAEEEEDDPWAFILSSTLKGAVVGGVVAAVIVVVQKRKKKEKEPEAAPVESTTPTGGEEP